MADISNSIIELTNVKPLATVSDIRSLCKKALQNKYRAVCVNSGYIRTCFEELKNHPEVLIVTTAGFPTGAGSYKAKIYEGIFAAEEGAKEVDFVLNLGYIKERKDKETRTEIRGIVGNTKGLADVKVILEAPVLTEEEIVRVSTIAAEEGVAYIKTATGFSGSTTPEMVKTIKRAIGTQCKIKAAGGIRDKSAVMEMVRAGADLIGTSTVIDMNE